MWIIGGLTAPGVTTASVLHAEIGSVREQVQDNRAALARIEGILGRRLPRAE